MRERHRLELSGARVEAAQLDERQGIAVREFEQHAPIRALRPVGSGVEDGVGVDEAERGEVAALDRVRLDGVVAPARGHHHQHRVGRDAPGDHEQRLPGGGIEPVQVFADHQQRVRASGVGEERQGRDAGEEGRRQVAGAHAERDVERVALRLGQLGDVVAQRPQQQVQPGVRRRGFVGGSRGAQHPHLPRPGAPLELVDQGRLADAGVALDEECRPAGVEFGAIWRRTARARGDGR